MPQRQRSSSSLPPYSSSTHSDNPTTNEKTRLDISQRLERKLTAYNASEVFWKRWLFEILSLLVSTVCMTAIIVVYVYIKNKPLAQLGSLLAFVNILGKVASAALIVPTTEALGQLKWNWFHKSNAMYDFEIFDKATRGPWGAAMLLYRTKGRSLAALGAMLILLLLAIDSFLQQVVDLPERWYLTEEHGMARRTLRYAPDIPAVFSDGYPLSEVDPDVKNTLIKFFYGNGTQPVPYGNASRTDIPMVSEFLIYIQTTRERYGVSGLDVLTSSQTQANSCDRIGMSDRQLHLAGL